MHSTLPARASLLPALAAAVVALFTIEHYRLFVSGLAFALGDARSVPPPVVGVVGLATMGLSFLALLVLPGAGRGTGLALTGLAALARLGSQMVEEPLLLVLVAAFGLVLGGLAIPALAVVHGGREIGVGILLGGAADVAIMAGRHTLDLTRSSSVGAVVVVGLLGLLGVGALLIERDVTGLPRFARPVPAAAMFMIGPWLALHVTVTGNLGLVGAVADLDLFPAAVALAVAGAIGLAWVVPGRASPQPAAAAGIMVAAFVVLISADGVGGAFLVAVAGVALAGAVAGAFDRETTAPPERAAWAAAGGQVVGFLAVAAFYLPLTGVGPETTGPMVVLMGLPILGAGIATLAHRTVATHPWPAPAAIGVVILAASLAVVLTDDPPTRLDELAGDPFVMTYNLHHGHDGTGRLALESMARVIEEAAPDIVALQEVSRGWVATGGIDMVAWLEHRLRIPVEFAPTADRQWGVAVGTPLPIANPLAVPLGTGEAAVARAALDVPVEVAPDREIRVIVAQLHQVQADVAIRREQTRDLVTAWGGGDRTIVAGDFGAGPNDEVVQELMMAGLRDPGRRVEGSPATWPADLPVQQHDYVLISPDLGLSAVRVVPFVASNHLAVIVRVGDSGVRG